MSVILKTTHIKIIVPITSIQNPPAGETLNVSSIPFTLEFFLVKRALRPRFPAWPSGVIPRNTADPTKKVKKNR